MKSVRRKLNPIPLEFKGRVVLLVDDSIVRGTTSRSRSSRWRATPVRARSTWPRRRRRCATRTSTASTCRRPSELIAHGRSEEEVQSLLGCDWLIYQDLADLEDAVSGPKHKLSDFDSSCFDGEYVTGLETGYLEGLQQARSDETKCKRAS